MRARVRSMWLPGLALAGMAAGHWLGYAFAVPDSAHRADMLARSGHGNWSLVLAVAAVAGAFAVAWVVARSFAAGRDGLADRYRLSRIALKLCGLQLSLFAALELVERALSHDASPLAMLAQRPFLIALAVQVCVGAVSALIIRAIARAASAVGRLLRKRRRLVFVALVPRSVRIFAIPVPVCAGATGLRGPPSL